jgi:hypothetical protein
MYLTVPAQAPATVEAVGISYTEIVVDWSEIEQKDRCGDTVKSEKALHKQLH